MKMRFWQKTYLFTLILFLFCLNIGILSLTVYTYRKNVDAVETAVKAEQYYVAMNFERDYANMIDADEGLTGPSLMMLTYGAHYEKKGLYLAFEQNGQVIHSTFREDFSLPPNSMKQMRFAGKRHLLISSDVCAGEYLLIVGKDISSLDQEMQSLAVIYLSTAAAVSVFFAVCLYWILKKLSAPLEKLRGATERIEAGDYGVSVPQEGNDEFALLAQSFNAMVGKVNEQMTDLALDAEKKQMLVDNMAHELRTPLTGIQGYAEFLEKAATTEEQRILAVQYIISETKRLQKISEILLDSGYLRGNPPEMTVLSVGPIAEDALNKLQMKAEKAGVELQLMSAELKIEGNETLLSMLFYNLIENAVKACENGGKVAITVDAAGVTVEDNGKGMTAEQLLHVTEPFYRTDKARSRADGGAGLGLALCKQIVETHGGQMAFSSEVGKGTKIILTFTTLQ